MYSNLKDQNDTFTVYDYLTHPETGLVEDGCINQVKEKAEPVISTKPRTILKSFSMKQSPLFTGYLCPDVSPNESQVSSKIIHLNQESFHFILYQFKLDWTFAFFLPLQFKDNLTLKFYKTLKCKIQESFESISSNQMQSCLNWTTRLIETNDSMVYFYYNCKTFAFKSTLKQKIEWTRDMMSLLETLVYELQTSQETQLLYVQNTTYWILGKRNQSRLCFLLLSKSEYNLSQVHGVFQDFIKLHLPNVF